MIKEVKLVSYKQNFVPRGLSALSPGLYSCINCVIFKCLLLLNSLSNLHQISHGAVCQKDFDNLFKLFHITEKDGHHALIWKKNLLW